MTLYSRLPHSQPVRQVFFAFDAARKMRIDKQTAG